LTNSTTICSVVYNDNKTNLFDLMVRSVLKYTQDAPQFIVCDNGMSDMGKYSGLNNFNIVKNISSSKGSLQHGESLNKIISLSNTQYTAIIESDCVVLSNKWNSINNYKMMAALKANGLYHVCFMVFETELLHKIDFRPGKTNIINRSYQPQEDVGWRIAKFVSQNEIKTIDFVDCKSGKGKIFDSGFQSDEYWLDGEPIAAHFGRGSNLVGKAIKKNFCSPHKQLIKWKQISENIIK